MEEKIKLSFEFTLRKIEKTDNPCKDCALSVGAHNLMCFNKAACKYSDDNPMVYYYEGPFPGLKCPYSIRVLEERLKKENDMMEIFKRHYVDYKTDQVHSGYPATPENKVTDSLTIEYIIEKIGSYIDGCEKRVGFDKAFMNRIILNKK